MKYEKVIVPRSPAERPEIWYAEIGDDMWSCRQIIAFPDGTYSYASKTIEKGGIELGEKAGFGLAEKPWPLPADDIHLGDPNYIAIGRDEFEESWENAVKYWKS